MSTKTPKVHLAFRFHTNFYHSYRGDTPDEKGFGIDIRVIRNTIDVLDRWNAAGIPVRGTWDIDNAFSLEEIMPRYCPDIITNLKRRVQAGCDEINLMGYNNGLISAHTAWEFDEAIGKALHNANGSGISDIFPAVAPVVRPQEMMFTPIHLKLYPAHGIHTVSLFYSGVPFNAFSNFIEPLPLPQRYNPLWLSYPGIAEKMIVIPAYNHGDIADWLSLRRWIKALQQKQLQMEVPQDLLLLIDADADDTYWEGYHIPILKHIMRITDGLDGLIRSVCDLPFLVFTTPYAYLEEHPPLTTVQFGQDTADGSFDGYASWADKWSNHQLWTGIERSRILELQALRLGQDIPSDTIPSQFYEYLGASSVARLRALSTTHFGLTAPILNQNRLAIARTLVSQAVHGAQNAYATILNNLVTAPATAIAFTLYDYARGVSTPSVTYEAKPSRALVQLSLETEQLPDLQDTSLVKLQDEEKNIHPACIQTTKDNKIQLWFVADLKGNERKHFAMIPSSMVFHLPENYKPAKVSQHELENQWLSLTFDDQKHLTSFRYADREYAQGAFIRSAANYAGHMAETQDWHCDEVKLLGGGFAGLLRLSAQIPIKTKGNPTIHIEHEFMLVAALPYLYVTTHIQYPYTESRNYNSKLARDLGKRYDNHWREVMPCELRPAFWGTTQVPLRIWKHNYLDHTSTYDLNYSNYSKNLNIDAFNNHITHAWVAVSDPEHGLLIAQTADATANFAFCPMRLRSTTAGLRIFLNPFGSYHGKQWHYPTAKSGIGRKLATLMAFTLGPQAGSYNGRTETIQLLIAPYVGDRPAEALCADAEAFAYPYAVVSTSEQIGVPPHRTWQMDTPNARGEE